MVCVVLTSRILKVVDSFDSFCNQGLAHAALGALLNPLLTDEEKETLFAEFGEHFRTRLILMCDDVHPCDFIRFYTLAPDARSVFVEELKQRREETKQALSFLFEIENGEGSEDSIWAFIARCRSYGADSSRTIH